MSTEANIRRSGIKDHRLQGKELRGPFSTMTPRPTQTFWTRDLLPEFLWIDSLINEYGDAVALNIFKAFLDACEKFNDSTTEIFTGLISSFKLIARRAEFRTQVGSLIKDAVVIPFDHVLHLYPDCPLSWLAGDSSKPRNECLDKVRAAVIRLFPGKDKYTARCRVFPLYRAFSRDKLYLASDLHKTIESIKQYPRGDTFMTEALARSYVSGLIGEKDRVDPTFYEWSEYFWKRNGEIAECRTLNEQD